MRFVSLVAYLSRSLPCAAALPGPWWWRTSWRSKSQSHSAGKALLLLLLCKVGHMGDSTDRGETDEAWHRRS